MKRLLGVAIAAVGMSAFAADIAFTGGASGMGTDLAVATNWEGDALPGSGDTGIVDYTSYTGGNTLTVGNDLAIGGLTIKGATAEVTLSGASTLSLGSAGLAATTDKTLTLKVPIAVTAASTWQFNNGPVNLCSTISGTDTLKWTEAGAVCVYHAIGYDGDMEIQSNGLRFYTAGKMAKNMLNTLSSNGSDVDRSRVMMNAGGAIRWSDMLTGGKFEYKGWRRLYVAATNNATEYAHITMDDPHDEFYQHGPYRSGICSGILEQRDGYIHATNYGMTIGSFESGVGNKDQNNGRFPVEYRQKGGTNDVCYLFIGENANYFTNNPVAKQSGGLALIRKGLYIGGSTDSSAVGFGEYVLSGGHLYVSDGTVATKSGSDHQTHGIALNHSFGNVGGCPGVFTQTGGTNTTWTFKFGPDTSEWGGNPREYNNAFGLVDLRGGEVNFVSGVSPFSFGKGWNKTATNSAYRINVSGGRMNFKDGHRINAQIEVPPTETASEWNVDSGMLTVDAPVSGLGTIDKVGKGRITFNNLNRFNGKLKVSEGSVAVSGEVADDSYFDDEENENCWIWTADSLKATYTNNQDVASWADDRQGVAAVDWTNSGSRFYTKWLENPYFIQSGKQYVKGYPKVLPRFKLNDYFNGHASVSFAQSILQIPAADNPLANSTNLTIAVVYREDNDGAADDWYGVPIVGGTDYWWGGMDTLILTHDSSNHARLSVVYQKNGVTRSNEKIVANTKKKVNYRSTVAVLTVNEKEYSLNVNGCATNSVLTGNTVRPLFMYGGAALPLNFGGHFPDSGNFNSRNVYISEIRMYRNQSFDKNQQALLARKLMMKYIASGENEFQSEQTVGIQSSLNGEIAPESPKATDCEWTADAANEQAEGEEVTSLASVNGDRHATTGNAGATKGPILVKGLYNGHSALSFSSADKTALGIASSDMAGRGASFTLAVVFSTATDSPDIGNVSFTKNSGVGIAVQDMATSGGHLGFTWHHEGTLLAGYGGSWFVNRRPFRLNDGLPHVAVFSRDSSGNYVWMVDGRATDAGTTKDCGWNTSTGAFLLGKIATGQDTGHFDGDILAVRLYDSALTKDEARTLSDHYAYKYGFRLLGYVAATGNVASNDFGRTEIEVDAGAQLVLPYSQTAPFKVDSENGRTLCGAGTVMGSVRYADGGVLDLTKEFPLVEDLQIEDGAVLKFGGHDKVPVDMGGGTTISGTITLDAMAIAAEGGPTRTVVMTGLSGSAIQPDAKFVVKGFTGDTAVICKDGNVTIRQLKGMMLIVK